MKKILSLAWIFLALLLTSCGLPQEAVPLHGEAAKVSFAGSYVPQFPAILGETTHTGQSPYGESGAIDVTNAADGYIVASCISSRAARIVIEKDGDKQTEFLGNDNAPNTFILSMGEGVYTATIYLQVEGTYYEPLVFVTFEAMPGNTLVPYLLPNSEVNYSANSKIVHFAREFASEYSSAEAFVIGAFEWASQNIVYDEVLLEDNSHAADGIYVPNLDRIIKEKTGICADYAAVFAALMRINGIPCQVQHGMLSTPEGEIYHAWNAVWLANEHGEYNWVLFDPTSGITEYGAIPSGHIYYNDAYHYGEVQDVY